MKKLVIISFLLVTLQLNAQWTEEWNSSTISSTFATGWINIHNSENQQFIFYRVDSESFTIMQSPKSESSLYNYSFSAEEIAGGNQIYSVGSDLTGDDIKEFYVLAYHDSDENPRQSFKIIDITTGNVLYEKNDASRYFTYPVIWDVDNDGQLECTYAVYDYPNFTGYSYSVVDTGVPTSLNREAGQVNSFELMQNYPNPFNPSTRIKFSTSKPGSVQVNIYSSTGELINRIQDGYMRAGSHEIDWDGTNQNGSRVSSGVYFYTLDNGISAQTKKMMILK